MTLDRHQFEIRDPDRFSPSARGLLLPPYYSLGARGNFLCVQLAAGRYTPRLTLAKRKQRAGFALTLRVEFSAPKLFFGNNFDELTSRDFEPVLETLHRSLKEMGIQVERDALRGARVSAIHFHGPHDLLDGHERIGPHRPRQAPEPFPYRLPEGHAIRYHANSFEVTFYDKLKDLEKAKFSEKRAIERDYGPQLHLFSNRGSFPKALEVLRTEVRLGNCTKIKNVVKQIEADGALQCLARQGPPRAILDTGPKPDAADGASQG